VLRHGWCGHVCPVGAFYSLLAVPSVVRVSAADREKCDDCMDCFAVCPEQQVIRPALNGRVPLRYAFFQCHHTTYSGCPK